MFLRNTKKYRYNNIEGSLFYICKVFDKDYNLVRNRIKLGWALERAIEEPPGSEKYLYNGELGSVLKFCKKYNKKYDTVIKRVQSGMNIKDALEIKVSRKCEA